MLTARLETVVLVLVLVLVLVVVPVVVPGPEVEKGADAALAQPPVVSAISARMSAVYRRRPAPGAGRRIRYPSAHVDAEEVAILRGEVALA